MKTKCNTKDGKNSFAKKKENEPLTKTKVSKFFLLFLMGILVYTGASTYAAQEKKRVVLPVKLSLTNLEVQHFSGEFEKWGQTWSIHSPQSLTFRWRTTIIAKWAKWEIAEKPFPPPGGKSVKIISTGILSKVPPKNKVSQFNINFGKFIAPSPPSVPKRYYVRVIPFGAKNYQFTPSLPVTIYYRKPHQGTTFHDPEDMDPVLWSQTKDLLTARWGPGPGTTYKFPVFAATHSILEEESKYKTHEIKPKVKKIKRIPKKKFTIKKTISKIMIEGLKKYPNQSPLWTLRFKPHIEGVDAMIAVGNKYIIVSHNHNIGFFDKKGKLLPSKRGESTKMSSTEFFSTFIAPEKPDGSVNMMNINQHVHFPANTDWPCNPNIEANKNPPRPPYENCPLPNNSQKNRPSCINEFYDTRAIFDPQSKRFFILSAARHVLGYNNDGGCSHPWNPDGKYDAMVRRYHAFAVSKTEDPRDGFYQYMNTESNYQDWPRISAQNGVFMVAYNSHQSPKDGLKPVVYAYDINHIKKGMPNPARFKLYPADTGGGNIRPVTQNGNSKGWNLMVRFASGNVIEIYHFKKPKNMRFKPKIKKTSVTMGSYLRGCSTKPIYRDGKLYFVGAVLNKDGVAGQTPAQWSIRLLRIPIHESSPYLTSLIASTDPAKGFMDQAFGIRAPEDAPTDTVSYEEPAMAVNKYGDMLIVYGRIGVHTQKTLYPEVRYSLWRHNQPLPHRSKLLFKGSYQPMKENKDKIMDFLNPFWVLDYATAVVDPANDTTFWMIHEYGDKDRKNYRTIVGRL